MLIEINRNEIMIQGLTLEDCTIFPSVVFNTPALSLQLY